MPAFCCVVKCSSNAQKDDAKFFRIPKTLNFKHRRDLNELSCARKKRWLDAINREDLTEDKLKNARTCSKHFITGKPAYIEDSLNPDWVPSLHMGYSVGHLTTDVDSAKGKLARYERIKKKIKLQHENKETVILPDEEMEINDQQHGQVEGNKLVKNQLCQTEIDAVELSLMNVKLTSYKDMTNTLKERVMCIDNLKNDDHKTKYYTGLSNFKLFNIVIGLIKPYIMIHGNMTLSPEEQILLTLIKIRLNHDFKEIGYKFHIHPTTASTYFKNVIHIMAQRLKSLVIWPERSILQKTMPRCFKDSFNDRTTVIIDCFEIRCERPSNLRTAAEIWSNYKHSETVKYLVGITPQGSVCFISEGWGGRTSDKILTQNSSFLNNLSPGDVVTADRGFLIKEFVQIFNASVKIPAFTRGKTQLDATDLEETRGIAHVRIHVERVIGVIRQKFRILDGTLRITLLCSQGGRDKLLLDEIVLVCCALVNLCPPIVPD